MIKVRKSKRITTEGNQSKFTTFRNSQYLQSISNYKENLIHIKKDHELIFPSKGLVKNQSKHKLDVLLDGSRLIRNNRHAMESMSNNKNAIESISKINKKTDSYEFQQLFFTEMQKVKRTISEKRGKDITAHLASIFQICEKMYDQIYSYECIELSLKALHLLVKEIAGSIFTYKTFAFAAFVLFQYGSFSLSLYYFDRALKTFFDRQPLLLKRCEQNLEIQIYKCVSKIFLVKCEYQTAKKFAYKYLRKSWLIDNKDEEMTAYDLLGKIQLEFENMSLSKYFHHRMRSGQKERNDILVMSKQQLQKQEKEKGTFLCYETINIFVQCDCRFNDILDNHYKMRSEEYVERIGLQCDSHKQVILYTHRSPNRLLHNYRTLERKLIQEKSSKELHFLRPKQSIRLKRIFSDFSSIVYQVKKKFQKYFHLTSQIIINAEAQQDLQPNS